MIAKQKKSWLVQTLVLSALLNVLLFGLFFYFLVQANPLHFAFHPTPPSASAPLTLTPAFLGTLSARSSDELIASLQDHRLVEQGYRVSDFAVAALMAFYDYDIPRALGKNPERRCYCGPTTLTLYDPLEDTDFEQLTTFLSKERFPYNTKGLLRLITQGEESPELLIHFCHTPEFLLLETLFARTQFPIRKGVLLRLVKEGGWERLSTFYEKTKARGDFSDGARQKLLLSYLEAGASTAAYLFLITDASFALNWMEERQLEQMLTLMPTKTAEAIAFTRQLLTSSHSEALRVQAAKRLAGYQESGEIAGHFVPRPAEGTLRPSFRSAPPAAPSPQQHIVQPGESLWLLATRYQISIEKLMELNHLSSTTLHPGQLLSIPSHD